VAGAASVLCGTAATLAVAYQHLTRVAALQDTLAAALAEPAPQVEVPADLQEQIRARITGTATAWDEALWEVVAERTPDEASG
jgi:hypothetical protein